MVRYTGDTKVTNNNFVELSEECQLAVNGGCSSNSCVTFSDIAHAFIVAYDMKHFGRHLHPCSYCD